MFSLNVAAYVLGSATVIWSGIEHKPFLTILIAAVWAALIVSLAKVKLSIPQAMVGSAFVLVATVVTVLTVPTKDGESIIKGMLDRSVTTSQPVEVKKDLPDPAGTIVVNGIAGTLTNAGYFSNISNIERDNGFGEAYLGDDGATATYNVEVATGGTYRLWVKLSDDALHFDGARNATITINGTQNIKYIHVSEDTKGWKWYDLGSVALANGVNTFAFVKDPNTIAAYVMNQFKLVP